MPEWKDFDSLLRVWSIIAIFGAIACIAWHCLTKRAGPILPPQRRRATPWTGAHVFLAFLIFVLPVFIVPYIDAAKLARWIHGPDSNRDFGRHLAYAVATLLALPFQVAMWYGLARLAGGPRPVLGVVPRRFGADFVAAFAIWLTLTPFVYAVNFVVVAAYVWIKFGPPDDHPVVRMVRSGTASVPLYVLLFANAVIAAPISEELFFRGIVQPYLADRPWRSGVATGVAAFIGILAHWGFPGTISDLIEPVTDVTVLFVLAVLPLYWWGAAWVPSRLLPVHDSIARRQAARAIIATSLVFANFHANVWPTPVPLFVLALGLGWLAYRTQSVLAPIVLHVLFNSVAMLALLRPALG